MTNNNRNEQICAPEILRDNQMKRRQITSMLTMVIMFATLVVGLTGLSGLVA